MAIKLRKNITIDPIDVSERSAVGIRLPFNKKNVFTSDYTTKEHAKSKLINVLLTSPGERLNKPFFGAGLKNRLFEQQSEISGDNLRGVIIPQVEQYVPEIEVKNITLKDGGIAGDQLFVTINYETLNNSEEDSVTLSFTNNDFESNY